MFDYQKNHRYFAQTPESIKASAESELASLGAEKISPGFRGIYFSADAATLYRINYKARLITRVLAPLVSFECRDRNALYEAGRSIDWNTLFSADQTFGVISNVSQNDNLKNSHFAALCVKDSVVDHFRTRTGKRPNVDKDAPDVWINLYVDKTHGVINLDTSGGSLHRRGYRKQSVEAPMQEITAAALVAMSGWNGDKPLYDPMCGSGTILCEALMAYCKIPSGFLKTRFGFFHLPDFKESLWKRVKTEADREIRDLPPDLIEGSDSSSEAVKAGRENSSLLPGGKMIKISKKGFAEIPTLENRTILCNPPYGIRMKTEGNLGDFYKAFGDFLKQRCKGSEAYVFFGNREMLKHIGLKTEWKEPVEIAGLDGRIAKYVLY
ncbi:MAG: class I SAM-dependent RNA methyltransferase [Desulfobacteraceae bacterium]|nr:class I SAM-dependent RNA methyltransferase [Desulfobacteraceae bacterium]MBU4002211.1 class I SAM-dependent RNA methyltransferase [Pseudomonadota bacterium]MBU4053300.1 class I SAM-dependent RNA methyltransferase [Pseudomonadota bacterium]